MKREGVRFATLVAIGFCIFVGCFWAFPEAVGIFLATVAGIFLVVCVWGLAYTIWDETHDKHVSR